MAKRLSLARLQIDNEAARGMLDVLGSRDRDGIGPLELACAGYRSTKRVPRLFITLLDVVRAAYYAGDATLIERAQVELHSLGDLFPAAEGHIALLKLELARDQKDWPLVARLTGLLDEHARRGPTGLAQGRGAGRGDLAAAVGARGRHGVSRDVRAESQRGPQHGV